MQKSISVPGIGLVLITKKTNAKKLKLRVHPEKGVLVTIPFRVNFSEGELFLLKNIVWVQDKLKNLNIKKEEIAFEPGTQFVTRSLQLEFVSHHKKSIIGRLEFEKIIIFYNSELIDFSDENVQDFIKKFIVKCLKVEAERYLPNRISILSQKTGLKYLSITIGTAGTRLGSCNSRNDIILSARLLLLPDDLIDYVILHELSHIVHKNHSERFHALLDQLCNGKSNELNKRLKETRIEIKPGIFKF